MNAKQVTIITIPLVYYHEKPYWCLYNEHTGKVREKLLNRPTGGKQIPFAFSKAIDSEGDILFMVDDKFNFEKNLNITTDEHKVKALIESHPLPETWMKILNENDAFSRVAVPPQKYECTKYSYSEKLLFSESGLSYNLPGECANEWALLLEHLEERGYEQIHAYIPRVCAKGICYATPYATENGIWEKPISIDFTDKDKICFEYKVNPNVSP